jgi:1-acylglycerone phosphate reductase
MSQKTILITGTNPGGIGNSLAREFHAKGLRVLATARNTDSIKDLADLGIETLSLEVTDPKSIKALKEEVASRTSGKLDYLVNNAGRNYTVPATDIDFEEVQLTYEVNVFGVMRMCQAFTPLLIEAKGTIVQIGSLAAVMPYVFGSVYNSTKAALHSYSNTLRVELEPFDVKVVTVVTGGVKSNIARTDRQLSKDSIYLPIEPEYLRRTKHSQEVGMPNEKYAKSVVSQVLSGRHKRQFWEGSFSYIVWFLNTFMPAKIFVSDLIICAALSLTFFQGLPLLAQLWHVEAQRGSHQEARLNNFRRRLCRKIEEQGFLRRLWSARSNQCFHIPRTESSIITIVNAYQYQHTPSHAFRRQRAHVNPAAVAFCRYSSKVVA